MTYQEANETLYDHDSDDQFFLAWDAFDAETSYSEDAFDACKECINRWGCKYTELNDYTDAIVVKCNFFVLDPSESKLRKQRQGD